jgi:predicted permease
MAALVPAPLTLTGGEAPERVRGAEVSPGYFALLGVAPALGRGFTAAEGAGRAADVVVLSDGLWRRRFAADPGVVGRTLALGGRPRTVVGVMPPGFDPPRFGWLAEQELWLPFAPTPDNRQWGRFLLVVARLRPDATLAGARREMAAIAAAREGEEPGNRGWSASVVPLGEQITGEVRTALLVLLGAVGLLLLIAVVNVATLGLAHARRRAPELAIRRAIGASRGRLVRQLCAQNLILGGAGAAVGLAAAWAGMRALVALLPAGVPRTAEVRLDAPVLLAATGVAVLATLASGTFAALRGVRPASAVGAGGRSSARLGGGSLIVAEVALGIVLTIAAGLMVRSFAALRAVDLGFAAEGVVVARVALDDARYHDAASRRAFLDALLAGLRATPGVDAASAISGRPFGGFGPATAIADARRRGSADGEPPVADVRWVDRSWFQTLRAPLLAGSPFGEPQPSDGVTEAVISRSAARAVWPAEAAVGRRLAVELFDGLEARVVGVVGDLHLVDPRTPVRPAVFLPLDRWPAEAFDVMVRGGGPPEELAAVVRQAARRLDPAVPVDRVQALAEAVDGALAGDRLTTLLLSGFALTSLLLAAVGIYAVFAGDVARRRRDLGIRRALGAPPSRLLLRVLGRGLGRAAAGVAIGLAGALLATRLMGSLLFGVGPADPLAFAAVAAALLAVAALATLVPAARAARVSPLEVMRLD